ncbi:lipid A deacylase LpxR family protein [Caulobacter sp. 602-2]|uniref:Lipid A deacylase LpxR family protein n=1 Tax=Caulobacter sp. 602-2 TaxID=2710887 RepID=A0A6G4R1Y5_9CAUL|nr:lipid A-modifier LpxR family protein [Caulobacter sp. 602-2]NGM51505.1 lipid A deacylase LpxR family protein [Caulobacter sp. 602-2]
MRIVCVTIATCCGAALALSAASSEAAVRKGKRKASAKPAAAAPPLTPTLQKLDLTRREPSQAAPASAAAFTARPADSRAVEAEGELFSVSPAGLYGDANLLDADRYYNERGPVSWRSGSYVVGDNGHSVDSVRVSVASSSRLAQSAPLSLVRPGAANFDADSVDVSVSRGWPAAVKFGAGKLAVDFTPHAGLGFGGAGGSAEAGGMVRIGKSVEDRVISGLGVRDGSETFGDRGRWYLFAGASGQLVGMNLLRGQDGDWTRAGVTSDTGSRLVGDAQAGVGWRRGPMQASVGYIRREIKSKDQIMGMATQEDSVVALSFSLKPHW